MIQLPPTLVPLLFDTELVTLADPAGTFVGVSFRDVGDAFTFHELVSLDVATQLRDRLTEQLCEGRRMESEESQRADAHVADLNAAPPQ